jgi:hypothetical protein
MPRPDRCPECGAEKPLRIVYGYPSPELREAADRDEVVLGGCLVWDGFPTWCCRACDHQWGGSETPNQPWTPGPFGVVDDDP